MERSRTFRTNQKHVKLNLPCGSARVVRRDTITLHLLSKMEQDKEESLISLSLNSWDYDFFQGQQIWFLGSSGNFGLYPLIAKELLWFLSYYKGALLQMRPKQRSGHSSH